jgi:hypothetical protein
MYCPQFITRHVLATTRGRNDDRDTKCAAACHHYQRDNSTLRKYNHMKSVRNCIQATKRRELKFDAT